MKRVLQAILYVLSFLGVSSAQETSSSQTVFEIQTAFSYVQLIGGNEKLLDSDDLGFYKLKASAYKQFGSKFQLGFLANRQINNRFWFRSGFQIFRLDSKADLSIYESFNNTLDQFENTNTQEKELLFRGMQIPLLLEYQHDFGTWKAYGNLGLTMAFSFGVIKNVEEFNSTFSYNYIYDPDCDCFPSGIAYPFDPTFGGKNSYRASIRQWEAKGLVGFGAILKRPSGRSWRLGYAFSSDLIPFYRGNNKGKRIYETYYHGEENHRHVEHQLELSMRLPEQNISKNNDEDRSHWNGWFLGASTSLQLPTKKQRNIGRTGVGWGRGMQVKYISKIGLGGRIQFEKWIAPASFYATNSNVIKAVLLYQLPLGVEFSAGMSRRNEIDVDGGGGGTNALLVGTGGMIPLNRRMGIALDMTAHFISRNSDDERLLIEPGLGFVVRLF